MARLPKITQFRRLISGVVMDAVSAFEFAQPTPWRSTMGLPLLSNQTCASITVIVSFRALKKRFGDPSKSFFQKINNPRKGIG